MGYIMRNVGLEEAQAGIKIAGRNINNLRYADDTTLMAESEELKRLLMKMKEESEKAGLKLNIQKTKIMASGLVTSWQIDGETMETEILFSWAPKSLQMVTAAISEPIEQMGEGVFERFQQEELNSLLMKVKEESEKVGLKLNI